MDLDQAIYKRRAVFECITHPVDDGTLRRLIDAAIQAPSVVNEQSWLLSSEGDPSLGDGPPALHLKSSQSGQHGHAMSAMDKYSGMRRNV
jgi:hypothetical protein